MTTLRVEPAEEADIAGPVSSSMFRGCCRTGHMIHHHLIRLRSMTYTLIGIDILEDK